VIDAPSGLALFINTGHPRPYLCDQTTGEIAPLGSQDFILGFQYFTPEEMCHSFTSGQRMVLYTDGILDAINRAGQRFGRNRLLGLISQHAHGDPEALAEAVMDEVSQFRGKATQFDDETVVVLDRM
jgi:sigma-B regulation protein RsbU (phosphoserine phosphatase)